MTIDERLQFLVQSTESLHSTVAQLADTVAVTAEIARENSGNIALLAKIAERHQGRIERLEDDKS